MGSAPRIDAFIRLYDAVIQIRRQTEEKEQPGQAVNRPLGTLLDAHLN